VCPSGRLTVRPSQVDVLLGLNTLNSLPDKVASANTTDTFKARLDKFWHNQDIIYNFRAQLHGTGSRSEVLCV